MLAHTTQSLVIGYFVLFDAQTLLMINCRQFYVLCLARLNDLCPV